jgi:uncharacterized protein YodC (DUF2158 family)
MANGGIKVGDIVQLKSGGPNMTVTGFNEEYAVCAWFDGNDNKNGAFPVNALQRSDDGPRR